MAEVKMAPDGRIDGVRIPFTDPTAKETAEAIRTAMQRKVNDESAFEPNKVHRAVYTGLEAKLKKDEQKPALNWRVVTRTMNNMLDPLKTGRTERVRFTAEIPHFWGSVCKLGTEEQRAWVKKRLLKFGKRFGVKLPDLDKDPKEFIDLVNELLEKNRDGEGDREAAETEPGGDGAETSGGSPAESNEGVQP